MHSTDVEWLAAGLRAETAAFAAAVDGVDPGARVPTCPGWQLRDLVGHLGQGCRWAADIVRSGAPDGLPDPRDANPGAPHEWSGWLLGGATELIDAIQHVGADTTVWSVLGPRPAGFWLRRMLHEVTVHKVDVALTAGTAFEIDSVLAADAITEGLELLSTTGLATFDPAPDELRGTTIQLRPAEQSITGWQLTRTPDGFTWDRETADADLTAAGAAQDLLLVLTRRLPPDDGRVTITGDRALLDHWLTYQA